MPITAIALNCTLKHSGGPLSSTDRLLREVTNALADEGVATIETIRVADHAIKPGVSSDEGEGDAWPDIRARILAADILILGTPIWLGQPSSLAKRVVERMDAFLSETDEQSRTPAYGKIAVVAVVGNEDGAHHVSAEMFQALNDVGFTIPAAGVAYWVGEAMGSTNYVDLDKPPEVIRRTTAMLAKNAAHMAKLLGASGYPGMAK